MYSVVAECTSLYFIQETAVNMAEPEVWHGVRHGPGLRLHVVIEDLK